LRCLLRSRRASQLRAPRALRVERRSARGARAHARRHQGANQVNRSAGAGGAPQRGNECMHWTRRLAVALLCSIGLTAVPLTRASVADGQVLPLPAEDQQEITALLGSGVVGQALPSAPITDVAVYFPLSEREATYQVTSGKNAGNKQTLKVAKGQRPGGTAAWRFGLSPSLAGFLRQTASGDLLMPAVSDSGEGVI